MDLLNGYGSDVSDVEEDLTPGPGTSDPYPGSQKQSTIPTAAQNTARQLTAAAPTFQKKPDADEDVPKDAGGPSSGLWSQLPRPASASAPSTSGLAGLPPQPSAGARGGARKVVTMQLPFRKELLAAALDSDDEEEPAAKRVKTTGAKSRLMDFLPPPKYDTGITRPLYAGGKGSASVSAAAASAGGSGAPAARAADGGAAGNNSSGNLSADFFPGGDVQGNEAYRVPVNDADVQGAADAAAAAASGYPGPYIYDAVYATACDQSACYAYDYGPQAAVPAGPSGPIAGGHGAVGPPNAGGPPGAPEDLIAEALRAEQERASKRGGGGGAGGGVKLVEINARDLTHMDPASREAANSARDALGPEYALSLRRSAAPFEGSKLARRKHQIGTLLFNARMQELEQMEKRTQGQKSKAETAAKYGW